MERLDQNSCEVRILERLVETSVSQRLDVSRTLLELSVSVEVCRELMALLRQRQQGAPAKETCLRAMQWWLRQLNSTHGSAIDSKTH